jgi:acetyl-CoA acetyltransferase
MSDVYVVGIGMIRFGRFPHRTVPDLAGEAAMLALDDAGVPMGDVQALYCGNLGQAGGMIGQRTLMEIGLTGIPVVNVANACATGATAFREGWAAIKAGLHDVVLAVGVEQMGKGLLSGGAGGEFAAEGVIGSSTTPAMFAQIGVEHMRKYGTTFEQFAKVSVKNHHHSTLNPMAMYQKETPLEEVVASEMIAYPNTKLMCSVNVDGSAAALLVSEKRMRQLGLQHQAARVRASILTSMPFTERSYSVTDFSAVTRLAAAQAYDLAGVGPENLDLVELHDCFATAEIVHYENLGLCADGEGGQMLESGATSIGGRVPVNLSGGLLSKGHPLGATGIANIYEVALHLRGAAGKRQVDNARIGLTHVVGGAPGWGSALHILEKA